MRRSCAFALACLVLSACRSSGPEIENRNQGSANRELPSGAVNVSGPVLSYSGVVDHVAQAVVTIRSSQRVRAPQQFPFFDSPFFQQFFGGNTPRRGGGGTEVQEALGSGVIVRPDGYILTNQHVVSGAEEIKVDLVNRQTYSAKLVGSDAPSDLAVLKIDASNLPILNFFNSDDVKVGDVCLAVGNPLGVGETVTAGIVSAKGRATGLSNGNFQDFLQTDAPINQGNSGGALVNTRAELIGINSQIISPSGGNIGIGFAIPSNMAHTVMEQLVKSGKVQRGMLGVGVQGVTSGLAASLGLSGVHGVLINSVVPGGPGDKAGLKSGDVVLKLNGHEMNDPNELRNEIAATAPGTDITLTIERNGMQQDIHARLGELTPQAARQEAEASGGGASGQLGMTVGPMSPDVANQLNLPANTRGVVVAAVTPEGPAFQAGIQAGDVIQEVNHQRVNTPDELRKDLQASGNRPPLLLINRGGQMLFVAVPRE